jgi:hypothetical protein
MLSEQEELVREGVLNGRGKPWKNRTECLRGHPYIPENTMWRAHGARRCSWGPLGRCWRPSSSTASTPLSI